MGSAHVPQPPPGFIKQGIPDFETVSRVEIVKTDHIQLHDQGRRFGIGCETLLGSQDKCLTVQATRGRVEVRDTIQRGVRLANRRDVAQYADVE
ncbi:hypothetical protein D3C72_2149850 [compost metagenome]